MNFFQNMFFGKKHVFGPKMASVTLHIPKDFWWHRIFGSATIFLVRKFWSTWNRGGGVRGEVSWPIDYYSSVLSKWCACFYWIYELINSIVTIIMEMRIVLLTQEVCWNYYNCYIVKTYRLCICVITTTAHPPTPKYSTSIL